MGTNYESGRAFEYRVRDDLRDKGYIVIRSAGSKTGADLVAFDETDVLLVQCTTNEQSKKEKDRIKLLAMAVNPLAVPLLAWKDGFRGPIVYERLDDGRLPWEDE